MIQTKLYGIQIGVDEIGSKLFAQNETLGSELKIFAFEIGMVRTALDAEQKNTSPKNKGCNKTYQPSGRSE